MTLKFIALLLVVGTIFILTDWTSITYTTATINTNATTITATTPATTSTSTSSPNPNPNGINSCGTVGISQPINLTDFSKTLLFNPTPAVCLHLRISQGLVVTNAIPQSLLY